MSGLLSKEYFEWNRRRKLEAIIVSTGASTLSKKGNARDNLRNWHINSNLFDVGNDDAMCTELDEMAFTIKISKRHQ